MKPGVELNHPLVSDLTKDMSRDYGILNDDGFAWRGTFIVDPNGNIRYYSCMDAATGRNPREILRALQALQHTDGNPGHVCPVNWTPGAEDIKV